MPKTSMKIVLLFLSFVCLRDDILHQEKICLDLLVCFVCAGQNFYIELSNKLEPTLRGYKQMSVDANLCELVVKLTVILVKVFLPYSLSLRKDRLRYSCRVVVE